jgi:hypothetical protein
MTTKNCYNCEYFSKRPGVGNYFIYKCAYWGLTTQNIIPQSVVISSIGKKCPFFKEKGKKSIKKIEEKPEKNNPDDGFDLLA